MCLGAFVFFHTFFLYINDSQAHEVYSHYTHCSWFFQKCCFLRLKVYFKKVINTCSFYASMQVVSMSFGQRVRYHLVIKVPLLLCLWKFHCVFFLIMCLFLRKCMSVFFFFHFQFICVLLLIFVLGLFIKKIYIFNLILKL